MRKVYHVIGIMSGTSLDGVDLVYVKFFSKKLSKYKIFFGYEIINAITYSYTEEWSEKLKFTKHKDCLKTLDIEYGHYLGNLVLRFKREFQIKKIDFISSHGHTIFHKPKEKYTLQIGNGREIAKITRQKVIYDFRTQDVLMGGQGAPLVPIGDKLLFPEYEYCLNLGGFANISYEEKNTRKAFDICPVNSILNHFSAKVGKDYDDKGNIARSGKLNSQLLEELNSNTFYKVRGPKSLGLEFLAEDILPKIQNFNLEISDFLRTFTEHIAFQISSIIRCTKKNFKNTNPKMLITGGGTYNNFLVNRIKCLSEIEIKIPEKKIDRV